MLTTARLQQPGIRKGWRLPLAQGSLQITNKASANILNILRDMAQQLRCKVQYL